MAYVFAYAVVENAGVVTTTVGEMPEHANNDMLIAIAAKDGTGAMTETSASGWTALSSGAGGAQWIGAWWKRATGNAEVAPTWTHVSEESNVTIACVRGAHTTTAPTSAISTDDTSQAGGGYLQDATYLSPSTNSIVLFGMGTDSGMGPVPMPGFGQVLYGGDAGLMSCGVSWQFFKAASVDVDNYLFHGAVNDNCRIVVVGVPDNGSNVYEPGRVDLGSTDPVLVGGVLSGATLVAPDTTWTAAASNSITMLGNDWDTVYNYDATTYNDETTDANDDGTGDVSVSNNAGAILYFGSNVQFNSLCVDVGTAGTGSPAAVWEYSTGSGAWSTLPFTVMPGVANWNANFTVAGAGVIRFTIPTNWVTDSVNSVSRFWIRRRLTTGWTAAPTLDQSLRDGRPIIFDASSSLADSGVNVYWGSCAATPATLAATPAAHGGGEYVGTATTDVSTTTQYFLTGMRHNTKASIKNSGKFDQHKGTAFTLMDANAENRRVSWIISASDSPDASGDKRSIIGIQPAQAIDTAWARHGDMNEAAIDTIIVSSSAPVAAVSVACSMFMRVGEQWLAGGTSTSPLDFQQTIDALVNGTQLFPILDPQGVACDVWHPVKFGGGDAMHMSISLRIFQFPTRASAAARTTRWHVDDNLVGFDFDARSGDTCKFTNCVFTSGSPYYWRFNASASSGATWDFTGCTVIGATVTLRSVLTFPGVTFIDCSEIETNTAAVEDGSIQATRGTSGVLLSSTGRSAALKRIAFVDNHDGDIGHSARITATGTHTFEGHSYSGGGPHLRTFRTQTDVNGTTDVITTDAVHGYAHGDAIYYQDQGGTNTVGLTDGTLYYVRALTTSTLAFYATKAAALADTGRENLTAAGSDETHYIYSAKADVFVDVAGSTTINVTVGGEVPTIRARDGATVTVNNTKTLTLASLVTGSEVRIFRTSDDVELAGVESSGTSFAYAYNYVSDVAVYVVVQKFTHIWQKFNDTLGATDKTVTVRQREDLDAVNP